MHIRVLVVSFLLLAAGLAATAGVVQPGHAQQGPPDNEGGQGGGQGGGQSGGQGGGQGNSTPDGENSDPGQGSGGPPDHSRANQAARDRSEARANGSRGDPEGAYHRAMDDARDDPAWRSRAEKLERLPQHARGNVGLFVPESGSFEGRFVSFRVAEDWLALENVSVDQEVVFDSIAFPPDENVSVRHAGNAVHVQGTDWRFSIVDAPPAPMTWRTTGAPFYAALPEEAVWHDAGFGGIVDYPDAGDGAGNQARLVGPDPRDADVNGLLTVSDSLNFHVSAQRVVLSHVANKERAALDEALTARALGGEVTLLRDPAQRGDVVSDVVTYDDLEIQVSAGHGLGEVPENATAHTVSVTGHGIAGKTIVLNLEEEIVDPRNLHLRYYTQVSEDTVEEVQIQMASSLVQVLDPSSSPLVPKYWVVEDIDGVQLLVLIPHFSTHHIELLSFDVDPVTVSLIAGVLGAVVVVALATAGLFRRPEDEW